MTFDLEQIIFDCTAALAETSPSQVVSELLRRAVSDLAAIEKALGKP